MRSTSELLIYPSQPQKYRLTVISIVAFFKPFNSRKKLKGYKKSKVMRRDSAQAKFRMFGD